MSFDKLGLAEPLLRAVRASGYTQPTPIQSQAIPAVLEGRDLMAAAQTGTGKTAGFTLPLLQRLADKPPVRNKRIRALVLTPTRELAAQVQQSVLTYGKHLKLNSAVAFGGVNITRQIRDLRAGADVLVATPGRLIDLYQQHAVSFDDLEILVLDEADRMLDMGFIHAIKQILGLLPKQRQNLMFSATFSDDIRRLAKSITNNPVEIDVAPRNSAVDSIRQTIHSVEKAQKTALLSHLIRTNNWHQVLVFSRTKHGADKLVKHLARDNIQAAAIHGNKSQPQRTKALAGFKKSTFQVLVATDIASRGIDIDKLPHVINFDLPDVPEDYVHRIGRTGRAGADGHAISLVSGDERQQLKAIERLIKRKIERETVDNFTPAQAVSEPAQPRTQQPPKQNNRPKNPARTGERRSRNDRSQPRHTENRQAKSGRRNQRAEPVAALVQ